MKLQIIFLLIAMSMTSFASEENLYGTWQLKSKAQNYLKNGEEKTIQDELTVKILNFDKCEASLRTLINGKESGSGELVCDLQNERDLIVYSGISGIVVLEGYIMEVNNQLVVNNNGSSKSEVYMKRLSY